MIRNLLFIFLFCTGNVFADYQNNEVKDFIDYMYKEYSYDKNTLRELFSEIQSQPKIKKYFKKAPERILTWNGCQKSDKNCTNYKNLFVTKSNISQGLEFWEKNKKVLQAASQEFGVPPEIIISIIGIESKYGARTGTFKTFDTLASLSLGPNKGRRAKFYRSELINFLLMCKENNFNPKNIRGSYAGALGKPQFISSSYRHYAVDFNNDQKIDLWNSNEDIIGSVANYFKKNGWKKGQPIMTNFKSNAANRKSIDKESLKSYKPSTPYKYFKDLNILASRNISDSTLLSIIRRKEQSGKSYSFGHKNFYVITRYNRSRLYALAVFFLSKEIKKAKSAVQ